MERWKSWTSKFLTHEPNSIRRLTDEESRFLLALTLLHHQKVEEPLGFEGTFAFQVLSKRAEYYKLAIDPFCISFLGRVSRTPGDLVMWCHALKAWQMKNANKPITWDMFVRTFIPMGVPTLEFLEEMWDLQKIGGNNLLDAVGIEDIEKEFSNASQ